MSEASKSEKLVLVTSVNSLLSNDTRVAWDSYRPASAQPGSAPTLYYATLPGDPVDGKTTVDLKVAGAQQQDGTVSLAALTGGATLTQSDGSVVVLQPDVAVDVPGYGSGQAATITFAANSCTISVVPPTGSGGESAVRGGGSGGTPPPPYPNGNN